MTHLVHLQYEIVLSGSGDDILWCNSVHGRGMSLLIYHTHSLTRFVVYLAGTLR